MSDIINNYQLFSLIFFLLSLFSYFIYDNFFRVEYFEDDEFEYEYKNENEKVHKSLGFQSNNKYDYDEIELEHKLQKLFINPKRGIILFLKNYNLFRVYNKDELENLYYFYENGNSELFKLKDEKIEKLRKILYFDIKEFLSLLHTSSIEYDNGYFKVEQNLDKLYSFIDDILKTYYRVDEIIEEKRLLSAQVAKT